MPLVRRVRVLGKTEVPKAKAPEKSPDHIDDPVFNRAEAAEYMGCSERWLRDRLADRTIGHIKLNKLIRFRRSQCDAYLASHTIDPEGGS